MNTILKLEHIQKYYGNEGNITKAIKDISFSVDGCVRFWKDNAAQLYFYD